MKRELLAVHAGGHQREQYRRGADERNDAHRRFMCGGDEQRPGVGDARTPGIGQHAEVRTPVRGGK